MRALMLIVSLALVAMTICCYAGCSGPGTQPGPATPIATQDGSATANQAPQTAGLPEPSKLPQAADIFSDGYLFANHYHTGLPRWNFRHIGPNRVGLDPLGGESDSDLAIICYGADLAAFVHNSHLSLGWYLDHDYGDAWVGMANYTDNRWDWYPVQEGTPITFDPTVHLIGGVAWFAVVVIGEDEWILDHIWFGDTALPVINSVTPTNGREGDVITLEANMRPGSGPVDSWAWNFGAAADPGFSTDISPEVTLQAPGTYNCEVTATNAAGSSNFDLTIVVREAWTTWDVQVVTPGFEDVIATSLALEDANAEFPHIAVGSTESIVYCRLVDGDWWEVMIYGTLSSQLTFSNTALDVDSSGHFCVIYCDIYDSVTCCRDDGIVWHFDKIDEDDVPAETRRFRAPRLVLDSDGLPHVSFHRTESADDWNSDTVMYSAFDGSGWSHPADVDHSGGLMDFGTIEPMVPLALDTADMAHIAYYNDAPGDISLARHTGGWSDEVVNHGQPTGMISLDIDSNDHAHLAYLASGQIYYSVYNGTDWDTIVIPGIASAGDWISLKLDSGDNPHIAYYQTVNKNLQMVYKDGSNWYNELVDALGDVGRGCSLAIDNEDRAHISYHDWNTEWVKLASEPLP